MHDRLGGHLDVLELGQVGVRPPPEREDDLLTGVDVVAVDEDLQRLGRTWGGVHGGDATGARPACLPGTVPGPRAGPGAGPRARPPSSRTAPTARRAPRRAPARPGRRSPTGGRRPGAGRRRGPGSHAPISPSCRAGYQSPPISVGLAHDRDAEEGVERQRQQDQQHPERVGHPARHRVDARPAARRTGSRPRPGARASASCTNGDSQRRVVPAGEVERPRRDDVEQRRSAAGRSAPWRPASAAPPAASAAAAAAGCAARG